MRPVPRSVVIKGIKYPIRLVRQIDPLECEGRDKDDVVLGTWDFWKEQIELLKNVPADRMRICLMHEVLHGLTEGMKLTEDDVDQLAFDLLDTLKRSKALRRCLFAKRFRRRWL